MRWRNCKARILDELSMWIFKSFCTMIGLVLRKFKCVSHNPHPALCLWAKVIVHLNLRIISGHFVSNNAKNWGVHDAFQGHVFQRGWHSLTFTHKHQFPLGNVQNIIWLAISFHMQSRKLMWTPNLFNSSTLTLIFPYPGRVQHLLEVC